MGSQLATNHTVETRLFRYSENDVIFMIINKIFSTQDRAKPISSKRFQSFVRDFYARGQMNMKPITDILLYYI